MTAPLYPCRAIRKQDCFHLPRGAVGIKAKSKSATGLTLVKSEDNAGNRSVSAARFKAGAHCGGQFAGDCSDHSGGVLFGRSNGKNQGEVNDDIAEYDD
jgi:hypothetical protein